MQEGWAVVIGAAIALIGSIGAPWLAGRVDAARRRAEARSDALRTAIGDYIELVVLAYARGQDIEQRRTSHNLASVAGTRLALLLERDEAELERIGDETLECAVLRPVGDPEGMLRVSAYQSTVHRWFRGEITNAQLRGTYESALERYREGAHPLLSQSDSPID